MYRKIRVLRCPIPSRTIVVEGVPAGCVRMRIVSKKFHLLSGKGRKPLNGYIMMQDACTGQPVAFHFYGVSKGCVTPDQLREPFGPKRS